VKDNNLLFSCESTRPKNDFKKKHFFEFAKIEQGDKPEDDDEQGDEKGRKLT
jgi:hypothetical protein